MKILKLIVAGVLLTQPVRGYDVTPTDAMCAEMLAEIKACFSGTRTVEQLLDEWKWGDIRRAFAFTFNPLAPERREICTVFGASPLSIETSAYPIKKEFLFTGSYPLFEEKERLFNGRSPRLRDLNHCYWAFGIARPRISVRRQSLAFVYSSKRSTMYPLVLKHLGLKEPLYEEARLKQPSLCWDTVVYGEVQLEPSPHDAQLLPWGALDAGIDVVYLFRQQNCMGVMLLNRKSIPSKGEQRNVSPSLYTAICDYHRLAEDFFWIPDRQAERFAKQIAGLDPLSSRRRNLSDLFNRSMTKHGDNGEYISRLGLRFSGCFEHPQELHLTAPWYVHSYYESPSGELVLQSLVWSPDGLVEKLRSFVVDVSKLPEGAQVLLPYGLDIKPYLREYPTTSVLYEHIRADKRSRIIVQPYIAYLYEDDRLSKVLVCHDKNGPPDHGWSLVRELYVCEATGYFWPVRRAYAPLED